MGFQFEQHMLGLWDLSWDLKKTISWEMGLGPPLHDPHKGFMLVATFLKLSAIQCFTGSFFTVPGSYFIEKFRAIL